MVYFMKRNYNDVEDWITDTDAGYSLLIDAGISKQDIEESGLLDLVSFLFLMIGTTQYVNTATEYFYNNRDGDLRKVRIWMVNHLIKYCMYFGLNQKYIINGLRQRDHWFNPLIKMEIFVQVRDNMPNLDADDFPYHLLTGKQKVEFCKMDFEDWIHDVCIVGRFFLTDEEFQNVKYKLIPWSDHDE